jgi:hypothetical protein
VCITSLVRIKFNSALESIEIDERGFSSGLTLCCTLGWVMAVVVAIRRNWRTMALPCLAKIIRIAVDPANSTYVIPPDNPFVGDAGFKDEIREGTVPIQRLTDNNIALCEELSAD